LGTNKVKAESNIGRVGESIGSSSNSMGITTIDTGTKDLGISVTLAIDTSTIETSIAIARNWVVVGVHTRSTLKSNAIAITNLGISIALAIDTSTIGTAIANTRHRVVVGIDTGSTLKSYSIAKLWISLSRDSGNNGGYNNLVMVWYGMVWYGMVWYGFLSMFSLTRQIMM
jgi:hypothetical protein